LGHHQHAQSNAFAAHFHEIYASKGLRFRGVWTDVRFFRRIKLRNVAFEASLEMESTDRRYCFFSLPFSHGCAIPWVS
jgi:hypothetical protein